MRTLLLTILGPDGSEDLRVSADAPLQELIPSLRATPGLVTSDKNDGEEWTLALRAGEALALDRTLAESGVLDGQVLLLRRVSAKVGEPQRLIAPPTTLVQSGSPLARRAAALPAPPTIAERMTGGGPYLARLDDAIRIGSLQRCVTIAVVSPKGGTGKSTIAVLLAALLSRLRPERVVTVDCDADYGSLGPWLAPEHPVSIYELADEVERVEYLEHQLEKPMALGPDGVHVCPAPRDPVLLAALDRDHYARVIGRLQDVARILILDCGAGLAQPGTQEAILASDQLVLVSDAGRATLAQASEMAGLLHHASAPIDVVINRFRLGGDRAREVDALFPNASALLSLSSEAAASRLLSSGRFTWAEAPRSWQRDMRELAAVLVWAWPQLRVTEPDEPPAI